MIVDFNTKKNRIPRAGGGPAHPLLDSRLRGNFGFSWFQKTVFLSFLVAALLGLTACEGESQEIEQLKQQVCQRTTSDSFLAAAAQPLAQNHPVALQYGTACDRLERLEGIHANEQLYLCRTFYPVDGFELSKEQVKAKQQAVDAAFGTQAPARLLSRAGFAGHAFATLITADAASKPTGIISTHEAVKALPVTLKNSRAAAGWAFLSGMLGDGYQPRNLCGAAMETTDSGWVFTGADVFYNCQPRLIRTLSVSQEGKVEVLNEKEKRDAEGNSVTLCID